MNRQLRCYFQRTDRDNHFTGRRGKWDKDSGVNKESIDKTADFIKMIIHGYKLSPGFHCLGRDPDVV